MDGGSDSAVSASEVEAATKLTLTVQDGSVGMRLRSAEGMVIVKAVDAGSTAEAQGVMVGAVVCEVNGEAVHGQDKKAVTDAIRAAATTTSFCSP